MALAAAPPTFSYDIYSSPLIGNLLLAMTDDGLAAIGFIDDPESPLASLPSRLQSRQGKAEAKAVAPVRSWLDRYFGGDVVGVGDLDCPLDPGGTEFDRRVWTALEEIPYGETMGYGELAARIGSPNAARAVGHANGRNPLPVLVPCHRVVGASGKLTGFGGGLRRKAALLDHEEGRRMFGRG